MSGRSSGDFLNGIRQPSKKQLEKWKSQERNLVQNICCGIRFRNPIKLRSGMVKADSTVKLDRILRCMLSAIGIGIMMTGLPVYYLFVYNADKFPTIDALMSKSSWSFSKIFLLLFFSTAIVCALIRISISRCSARKQAKFLMRSNFFKIAPERLTQNLTRNFQLCIFRR